MRRTVIEESGILGGQVRIRRDEWQVRNSGGLLALEMWVCLGSRIMPGPVLDTDELATVVGEIEGVTN